MSEIEDKLRQIIKKFGEKVEVENINDETDLIRDFNYDSIGIIQLIVDIESIFQIEIDNNNLGFHKLSQYGELVKIVNEKVLV